MERRPWEEARGDGRIVTAGGGVMVGLDGGLLEEEGHDVGVVVVGSLMSGVSPY